MRNPFIKKKTAMEELREKWVQDALWHDSGSEEATRARENITGLMDAESKRKCKIDPNVIIEGGFGLATVALIGCLDKIMILPKNTVSLAMKLFKR